MVQFGNASGPVPDISPLLLSQKGSLFLTRPTLMAYTATRADLELSAGRVIDAITKGWIKIKVPHTYPLKEAAQAHRDLEARKTTGLGGAGSVAQALRHPRHFSLPQAGGGLGWGLFSPPKTAPS